MHPDLMSELRSRMGGTGTLRRARGNALFAAAPARTADPELWHRDTDGALHLLTPTDRLLRELYTLLGDSDDALSRSLTRTKDFPPSDAARHCFIEGLKLTEKHTKDDIERYEREVRQTAALSLRTHTGNAHACACLLNLIKGENAL